MITLNNHPINITIFPDKTSQVWHLPENLVQNNNRIDWKFEHEGELFHLIQLCTLVREMKLGAAIELHCPYLPYARQHKVISNETTFALEVFCDLIEFYINSLHVFDVHNYNFFFKNNKPRWNFKVVNALPEKEINDCINTEGVNFIVFPDESATHRYSPLISLPNIFIEKIRDQATGEITNMEMPDIPVGANILVIDDLSDGAKSHIEAAKLILTKNPNKLCLYVSHGLFTKGVKIVHEGGYNSIYTKDGLLSNS